MKNKSVIWIICDRKEFEKSLNDLKIYFKWCKRRRRLLYYKIRMTLTNSSSYDGRNMFNVTLESCSGKYENLSFPVDTGKCFLIYLKFLVKTTTWFLLKPVYLEETAILSPDWKTGPKNRFVIQWIIQRSFSIKFEPGRGTLN